MAELLMVLLCPAFGGALAHHLWISRPIRQRDNGLAVGKIRVRRRPHMAVRRARGDA